GLARILQLVRACGAPEARGLRRRQRYGAEPPRLASRHAGSRALRRLCARRPHRHRTREFRRDRGPATRGTAGRARARRSPSAREPRAQPGLAAFRIGFFLADRRAREKVDLLFQRGPLVVLRIDGTRERDEFLAEIPVRLALPDVVLDDP